MATADEVYGKRERAYPNASQSYAKQLYGNTTPTASIGSSSVASENDYSNYLSSQNQQISQGNGTATASSERPYLHRRYGEMSPWDRSLAAQPQRDILTAKSNWHGTQGKYNKTQAHVDAQLQRAKHGGYIDPVGDGSGYLPFGYDKMSVYDREFLSPEDQDKVMVYKIQYQMAKTPEERQAWNKLAEEVRAKYGYSGGPDGSKYIKLDPLGLAPNLPEWNGDGGGSGGNGSGSGGSGNGGNPYTVGGVDFTQLLNPYVPTDYTPPEFRYGNRETDAPAVDTSLVDRRNNYTDEAADAYLRMIRGDYDPNTDPAYRAYANIYERNADASANRAMAQAASNTGGVANSYAAAVAAASRNAEMRRVQDAIPALMNNYYNRLGSGAAGMGDLANSAQNAYQYSQDRSDRVFEHEEDARLDAWKAALGSYDNYWRTLNDYGYNGLNDIRKLAYDIGSNNRDLAYDLYRAQVGDALNVWDRQQDVFLSKYELEKRLADAQREREHDAALRRENMEWQSRENQRELDADTYRLLVQLGYIRP